MPPPTSPMIFHISKIQQIAWFVLVNSWLGVFPIGKNYTVSNRKIEVWYLDVFSTNLMGQYVIGWSYLVIACRASMGGAYTRYSSSYLNSSEENDMFYNFFVIFT
jgi:hypothetical protein